MLHFLKRFFEPDLPRESFIAYFNRLPDSIEVEWKRDGNFFVGRVKAGEYEFVTQGRNAREFIDTVNSSVSIVYDIPRRYIDLMMKVKTYLPADPRQLEALNQLAGAPGKLFLSKNKKLVTT